MSYKKLVRDNIPDIIKENGEEPVYRVLSDKEFLVELKKKLLEESNEVINSSDDEMLSELGDLLEVMISLAKVHNISLDDIIISSSEKRDKRGSFTKKIYLEDVKKINK